MDNEKDVEECKCKQICSKLQNASLRYAIETLKSNKENVDTIKKTLKAIYELLEVYSCLPGTCLLKRVEMTNEGIKGNIVGLYDSEKIKLEMLIIELETFLSNS